jgi:hypothetical protein
MAESKGAMAARRSGLAPRVVAPKNKVTIALPLSMIRTGEPGTMGAGDWVGLAGVAVAAIGFGVVVRELIRIAHALEADRAIRRESPAETSQLQPA